MARNSETSVEMPNQRTISPSALRCGVTRVRKGETRRQPRSLVIPLAGQSRSPHASAAQPPARRRDRAPSPSPSRRCRPAGNPCSHYHVRLYHSTAPSGAPIQHSAVDFPPDSRKSCSSSSTATSTRSPDSHRLTMRKIDAFARRNKTRCCNAYACFRGNSVCVGGGEQRAASSRGSSGRATSTSSRCSTGRARPRCSIFRPYPFRHATH